MKGQINGGKQGILYILCEEKVLYILEFIWKLNLKIESEWGTLGEEPVMGLSQPQATGQVLKYSSIKPRKPTICPAPASQRLGKCWNRIRRHESMEFPKLTAHENHVESFWEKRQGFPWHSVRIAKETLGYFLEFRSSAFFSGGVSMFLDQWLSKGPTLMPKFWRTPIFLL